MESFLAISWLGVKFGSSNLSFLLDRRSFQHMEMSHKQNLISGANLAKFGIKSANYTDFRKLYVRTEAFLSILRSANYAKIEYSSHFAIANYGQNSKKRTSHTPCLKTKNYFSFSKF